MLTSDKTKSKVFFEKHFNVNWSRLFRTSRQTSLTSMWWMFVEQDEFIRVFGLNIDLQTIKQQ